MALWSEQQGVDPETGERWLTPASQEEATLMALRAMDGFRLRAEAELDATRAKLAAAEAELAEMKDDNEFRAYRAMEEDA